MEVVIALGITSVALLAILSSSGVSSQLLQSGRAKGEWNQLQGKLRGALSSTGSNYTTILTRQLYLYCCRPDATLLFQPQARWQDDAALPAELPKLQGTLFRVKFTLLDPANPGPSTSSGKALWAVVEKVPSGTVDGAGQAFLQQACVANP